MVTAIVQTEPREQAEIIADEITTLEADKIQLESQTLESEEAKTGIQNLISSMCRSIEDLHKVWEALKAGYNEIDLRNPKRNGWIEGIVEDPRPYRNPELLPVWLSWLPMLLFVGLAAGFTWGLISSIAVADNVPGLLLHIIGGWSTFFVSLLLMIIIGSVSTARDMLNTKALKAVGLNPSRELHFLEVLPPTHVLFRYREALGSSLFDRIRVLAPLEAFTTHKKTDPIIYGEAGGRTFLIAQYDL